MNNHFKQIMLDTTLRHDEVIEAMTARNGPDYVDTIMLLVSTISALRVVSLPDPISRIVAYNISQLAAKAAGIANNPEKVKEMQANSGILLNLLSAAEDELAKD